MLKFLSVSWRLHSLGSSGKLNIKSGGARGGSWRIRACTWKAACVISGAKFFFHQPLSSLLLQTSIGVSRNDGVLHGAYVVGLSWPTAWKEFPAVVSVSRTCAPTCGNALMCAAESDMCGSSTHARAGGTLSVPTEPTTVPSRIYSSANGAHTVPSQCPQQCPQQCPHGFHRGKTLSLIHI